MTKKSQKLAELKEIPFVFERQHFVNTEEFSEWKENYLGADSDIVLELACGNGEYSIGMARNNPNMSFIGVDLKGARLWNASREVKKLGLTNVMFLREDIKSLPQYFMPKSVAEIWITFPDPRPKIRDKKHRLVNPAFLGIYAQLLRPNGWVHFITDSDTLFDYGMKVIADFPFVEESTFSYTTDIDQSDLLPPQNYFPTKYENKFRLLGAKIKYLRFQFKSSI